MSVPVISIQYSSARESSCLSEPFLPVWHYYYYRSPTTEVLLLPVLLLLVVYIFIVVEPCWGLLASTIVENVENHVPIVENVENHARAPPISARAENRSIENVTNLGRDEPTAVVTQSPPTRVPPHNRSGPG